MFIFWVAFNGILKESHLLKNAIKVDTSAVKTGIKYFIGNIYLNHNLIIFKRK